VPLENNADNLKELEDIENVPPQVPPHNVPATNDPPSDASTNSARTIRMIFLLHCCLLLLSYNLLWQKE